MGKNPKTKTRKQNAFRLFLCVSLSHARKSANYCCARSQYTNCKSCSVLCYTKWWTCFASARRKYIYIVRKKESKTVWFSTICCMFYLMPNWNTIFIRGQPSPSVFYVQCGKIGREHIHLIHNTHTETHIQQREREEINLYWFCCVTDFFVSFISEMIFRSVSLPPKK